MAYHDNGPTCTTIRASGCAMMFSGNNNRSRCSPDTKFRSTLVAMFHRSLKVHEEDGSCNSCNFRYLNTPEKTSKLRLIQKNLKVKNQQLQILKMKLHQFEERSTEIDILMHQDLWMRTKNRFSESTHHVS